MHKLGMHWSHKETLKDPLKSRMFIAHSSYLKAEKSTKNLSHFSLILKECVINDLTNTFSV